MRTPEEIIADIVAEATQGSYGEPEDPREYRPGGFNNTLYHNAAQRAFIYDKAMELAAAVVAQRGS